MDLINPNTRNSNSEEHAQKLWAHLHIISNFELNVDSPYKKPEKELYHSKPDEVPYPKNDIRFKHYGKIMEDMVKAATIYPEGDDKKKLISKLNFFVNNKAWYDYEGHPHTFGLGLHGPPGTGKTCLLYTSPSPRD